MHEWLADRVGLLPAPVRSLGPVIVQDPCHLRHVQQAHLPVRTVLGHVAEVVELDDDGLCCGAGGAYTALEPELAGEIRVRKLAAIERSPIGRDRGRQRQPGLRDAPGGGRAGRSPPARARRRGALVTGPSDEWLDNRVDELAERLDAISEELAELAIELLRAALADRAAAGKPPAEKPDHPGPSCCREGGVRAPSGTRRRAGSTVTTWSPHSS